MKNKLSKNGFTLIEILIALAIISILFVIMIPQVNGYFEKSKEASVRSVFRDFQATSQSYLSDSFGKELDKEFLNMHLDTAYEIIDNTGAFETKAKDPWGTPYGVEIGNKRITIFSFGKEGEGNKRYTLSSYYHKGMVDFCTTGFQTNNLEFSSIKDTPSDFICGNELTSSPAPSIPTLEAPENFKATDVTNTSSTLSWSSVNGATSYILKRNGVTIYTGNSLSYSDITLEPGQTYTYSVAAKNLTSLSSFGTLTVTTDSNFGTPTGFTANNINDTNIHLSWSPSAGADSYLLKRDGVTVYSGSSTFFIDNGLKDYTTYHYSLVALDLHSASSPAFLSVKTKTNYETVKLPDIGTGSCSPYNPYVIKTLGELQGMSLDLTACYELGANIEAIKTTDWNGAKGFKPIGYYDYLSNTKHYFSGSLNGDGYTIANLTIDRPDEDEVGFIGILDRGGRIENIKFNNIEIEGKEYVGGVAAYTAPNSMIAGLQIAGNIIGVGHVGGVAGYSDGNIEFINSDANIISDFDVSGVSSSYRYIGGIIGHNGENGVLVNATSSNVVEVRGEYDVGGIIGANQGTVKSSFSNATVFGNTSVGGAIGCECKEEGQVSGVSEIMVTSLAEIYGYTNVGGIIGYTTDSSSVINAFSAANVVGQQYVGGAIGYNKGIIKNFAASGIVSGFNNVGGLVGLNDNGTITSSYYDKILTGQNDTGKGIPKTTIEMKTKATYVGWDFTYIWDIIGSNNNGYPSLKENW